MAVRELNNLCDALRDVSAGMGQDAGYILYKQCSRTEHWHELRDDLIQAIPLVVLERASLPCKAVKLTAPDVREPLARWACHEKIQLAFVYTLMRERLPHLTWFQKACVALFGTQADKRSFVYMIWKIKTIRGGGLAIHLHYADAGESRCLKPQ